MPRQRPPPTEKGRRRRARVRGAWVSLIKKFWDIALKAYLGSNDESVCKAIEEKAMFIGYTRMLRRAIRRTEDADSPAKIALCKEILEYLLNKVDTLTF